MIGDLWASRRTGTIYRVGPRGTSWATVGHVDDLGPFGGLGALLGYAGGAAGLSVMAGAVSAAMLGLLAGAILMFLPAVIPLTVTVLPLLLVVVGVRSLVTRRRLTPVLLTAALFAVLLVVVVLHVVYWQHAQPGLYLTLASAPLMPVLTAALAVWALSQRRWVTAALLLGQAVVFASSYLGALGSATYAQSGIGIDNVLTLTYWACLASLIAAVLTPRRGEPAQAVAAEVAA